MKSDSNQVELARIQSALVQSYSRRSELYSLISGIVAYSKGLAFLFEQFTHAIVVYFSEFGAISDKDHLIVRYRLILQIHVQELLQVPLCQFLTQCQQKCHQVLQMLHVFL